MNKKLTKILPLGRPMTPLEWTHAWAILGEWVLATSCSHRPCVPRQQSQPWMQACRETRGRTRTIECHALGIQLRRSGLTRTGVTLSEVDASQSNLAYRHPAPYIIASVAAEKPMVASANTAPHTQPPWTRLVFQYARFVGSMLACNSQRK